MLDINDFAGIVIVGVGLSFLIEAIKGKWGAESKMTKLVLILLSIGLGIGYYYLQGTPVMQAILGILGAASGFWAFFIRKA